MAPIPSMTPRRHLTASEAASVRGHEGVFGVTPYWPGYWFSDGVPAARS